MNIYQKLLEVRKAVPFLKKENAGYQFKYVSSSQTLGALREAMDANGLVLIPKVIGERVLDHTTKKGEHQYFTVLNMEFTWVNTEDPKETVVCPWVGQGLDDGEKGVGKALTYSEKFFLLKFFNVATDKDDPDANQGRPETDRQASKPTPLKSQAASKTPPASPASADGKAVFTEIHGYWCPQGMAPQEAKATTYAKFNEYADAAGVSHVKDVAGLESLTAEECKKIRLAFADDKLKKTGSD